MMESLVHDFDYEDIRKKGTGYKGAMEEYRISTYYFEKYEIKVKLTLDNKFIDIVEIGVNKDFVKFTKENAPKGYHDVDEFYKE